MMIKIGGWVIPLVLTVIILAIMFRPYKSSGTYDFGAIFRVAWIIPILAVWLIYFIILAFVHH